MGTPQETKWPRVRDLPEHERAAFTKALAHQTRPLVESEAEQDFYYPWDYEAWKRGVALWD